MGTNLSPSAGDGSEGPVADSEGHGDEDKREFPSDGALMPCMSSSDEGESGVEIRGSQWNLEVEIAKVIEKGVSLWLEGSPLSLC
ncbi:hypothetical protein LWI29_032543 [Acer saccharum]|uniref:Uncharacterized protein n=1 Tax=Acer saccharum TaxID=4024 RepID=A0AA39W5V8_ACESA|nr:hypothetical protein LWI29_032543 [Acer saccharum]